MRLCRQAPTPIDFLWDLSSFKKKKSTCERYDKGTFENVNCSCPLLKKYLKIVHLAFIAPLTVKQNCNRNS